MKHCIQCHGEMRDFAEICPHCGVEQKVDFLLALPLGTLLHDRYRIDKVLGRGGTAITYQVYDRHLERISALKEYFPAEIANRIPGSREVILYAGKKAAEYAHGFARFQEEAQNMMRFHDHPHIIHVYDYFEENKTAYIVMEYLQGVTLKDMIEEAPLPYEKAVAIGATICTALTAMHKQKILHRDISPDNIFICTDGTVKLIDFGAARFAATTKQQLTITYKGGFTPPEQFSTLEEPDPRSDIYALAATLYMAISGVRPDDAREREVRDEVKPLYLLCPAVPQEISDTIECAMSVPKELRPLSAAAFADGLQQHEKSRSLQDVLKRRKKLVRISLGATFGILCIALVVCTVMWFRRIEQTTLPDAEISIWYTTGDFLRDESKQKRTALTAAVQRFQEAYPNVDIRLLAIEETSYAEKLKEGVQNGQLPTIFSYTEGANTLAVHTTAIEAVLDPLDLENYFGYEAQASAPYIYTGYNIPLLYSTDPAADIAFFATADPDIFTQLQREPYPIGMSLHSRGMYEQIFQMELPILDTFPISPTAAALLVNGDISLYYSDTAEYRYIQQNLAGKYIVTGLSSDIVYCAPADCWSISSAITEKEKACAVRFLQFLLSTEGQECLYIENQYPAIPAECSVRETYAALYTELAEAILNPHNKRK